MVPDHRRGFYLFLNPKAARHDGTMHALGRPASEKRQGTKSREMEHRRCRGRRVPRALWGFCRGIEQQNI
jgi:hypothetical protein